MQGLDRSPWGWNRPAQAFLVVLAGSLAAGLAWMSRDDGVGSMTMPALVIDPNTAPSPVLMALPGIGPALTGNIIKAREARPFVSIEDFDRRVRGIGPVKVAALRPFLRFKSPLTPQP